jgi:hypothetical protein
MAMDQNASGGRSSGMGGEDASQAREHAHNAEENRDALAAQNRRVERTTPAPMPDVDTTSGGMNAAPQGGRAADGNDAASEDASAAREHAHNAEENRDALAAQHRRVEATAPEETNHDIRDR